MAIHSSILAWRIPWTEESGGFQSVGHKESDTTEHAHRGNRLRSHRVTVTSATKNKLDLL